MFKRVCKIVVLLACAVVLTLSLLGITTVTGHTPTAHADGLGGAQLFIGCLAGPGSDPANVWYIQVDGENQYGNMVKWTGTTIWTVDTAFASANGGPSSIYTYVVTTNWWWVGTVTATFQDGVGDTWQESAYLDPGTYGGTAVWWC